MKKILILLVAMGLVLSLSTSALAYDILHEEDVGPVKYSGLNLETKKELVDSKPYIVYNFQFNTLDEQQACYREDLNVKSQLSFKTYLNEKNEQNIDQIVNFINSPSFVESAYSYLRNPVLAQLAELKNTGGYLSDYSIYLSDEDLAYYGTYNSYEFRADMTTYTASYSEDVDDSSGLEDWINFLADLVLEIADSAVSVTWSLFSNILGNDWTAHYSDWIEVYITENVTTSIICIEDYNDYMPDDYVPVVQEQRKRISLDYEYYSLKTGRTTLLAHRAMPSEWYYTENYGDYTGNMQEGWRNYINWQGGYISEYTLPGATAFYFD
ncbi:MAG: hypothetical protein Q4B50_02690 [Bacillota bacterium]|nr:hypothetical protein [Bacillota bacterium]